VISRRGLLIGTLATLGLAPGASASSPLLDVLYFRWTPDISEALDNLHAVKSAIGQPSDGSIEIVRHADTYGVVLRVGSNAASAEALANDHSKRLADHGGTDERLAASVPRQQYERVFNVSYGLGPNLAPLVVSFGEVSRMLGPDVARSLVIEKTDHDNYALVYKRYGDLDSTRSAAKRHDALLKSKGLHASFIQEQAFGVVYNGTGDVTPPPEDPPTPVAEPQPSEPAPVVDPPPPAPVGKFALVTGTSPLRDTINTYIQSQRGRGRVSSDERTAWLVYDLNADAVLAAINSDVSLQCASMVKPFVMLAFFHEVARGRFIYGSKSRARLEAMIQRSSNTSTNWTIDQIGGPASVQKILDTHYGEICQGTQVVERIASNGRTYKNLATAEDYGRLLRAMWKSDLPHSKEQRRIMNLPGRDRLYDGAPSIPVGTHVYNKTGSTARLCGDMGILVVGPASNRIPYIVVGVIEKSRRTSSYSSWIASRANIIRAVSDRAYRYVRGTYLNP